MASSKTVHISNIDFKVKKTELDNYIKTIVGNEENYKLFLSKKNVLLNKGWANVEFSSTEIAQNFIDKSKDYKLNNRVIKLSFYKKPQVKFYLKLTNLNYKTTKKELMDLFNQGKERTEGLQIVKMPFENEKNKGFCIFTLPTDKQARDIVYDLDRTIQFDKKIFVCRLGS